MYIEKSDLRILFMGTPEFARASIETLINAKYKVIGAFTNPDKKCGRGMKLNPTPVKQCCVQYCVPVYQPNKLRNNPEVLEILNKLKPNVICVTAYGKILPKEVLEFPKYGCINVHGSILPKYRGAAPIQWSIINGDKVTGITTMFMDEGMDTGDMLLKEEIPILDSDDYGKMHDKLKVIGANLLVKTLDELCEGKLERIKQPDNYSYAPMIDKDLCKIDFNKNVKDIFNLIRGLSPVPGAYFFDDAGKRYKVYSVEKIEFQEDDYSNAQNGTIVDIDKSLLKIKCNNGYILIKTIQPENSKKMGIDDFLRGSKFKVGDKLN